MARTQRISNSNRTVRTIGIVGGGPAGAQCARALSEAGFAVTLFEPRVSYEKPCGGGIPARGLDYYPFLRHPDLPMKEIRRCLVIAPSDREAAIDLADPLYILNRADLHTFLLRRAAEAGTRIIRARVLSFRRQGGRATTGRTGAWILRAGTPERERTGSTHGPFDFLVAADGAAGACRRKLINRTRPLPVTQGIGYYIPGLSEGQITLKFYHSLNGYLWVFPRPDHSSAGICGRLGAQSAADLRLLMDRFLQARYGGDLLDGSERYAALIPGAPEAPESSELQGDGWAAVGDAGRFVDPITREGIFFAMRTGDLLADCLIVGEPHRFALDWERGAGLDLVWAARHAGRFFNPRFIERMVHLCARSTRVATVMSDLIAGRQPYRTLRRRLLLNGPMIAWQLAAHRWGRDGQIGRPLPRPPVFRPSRGR